MNNLKRNSTLALGLMLGGLFLAGCGAEPQGEADIVPEAPNATPKAPNCNLSPPPNACSPPVSPPCRFNDPRPECAPQPPPATNEVYVDLGGNLRFKAAPNRYNNITVTEPTLFVLEVSDSGVNVALDPGSGCFWPSGYGPGTGNYNKVRCNVPWYGTIIAELGNSDDGFWGVLPRQAYVDGGDGNDTIVTGPAMDYLLGGSGDDFLFGGDGNDEIYGFGGNDTLYGSNGDDILKGDTGNDTLYGEAGTDKCEGEVEQTCELNP